MKKMVKLSVVAAVAMTSSAFAASDLAGAFKEGTTSGYVRAMYIGQNNKGTTADVNSLGLGGKLGFVTGSLSGFKAGATFFTTNAINQPNDLAAKTDDYMFGQDSKGYNLLGEAYIQYNIGKTTVKVGRQQLDTPLAGSDDVRIIPNMFEAYTVINTDVADTTLVASHVTKMAGFDARGSYTNFKSMSEQAYSSLGSGADLSTADLSTGKAPVGKQGVTALGAVYSGVKDLTVQGWNYYGHELINATYVDAVYAPKVTSDLTLTVAGQGYKVAEIGKLKSIVDAAGKNVSYEVYGAKAAVASEATGLTATLAYNKVTGNDKTVTVFGAWGGYPEYALGDEFWMNSISATGNSSMAKSSLMRAAVDLNLGTYGLGDRTLTVAQSKFNLNEAIKTDGDVSVTDFIYACKPAKDVTVRAVYEMRDYKGSNNTSDNNLVKVMAQYSF